MGKKCKMLIKIALKKTDDFNEHIMTLSSMPLPLYFIIEFLIVNLLKWS